MAANEKALIGSWEKITSSPCSETYPDRLEFRDGGRYRGQKEPVGTYAVWDVGGFEIIDEKQVKISTASDSIISYEFSLSGDSVTFVDPQRCEIKYRRVP
jgi:hypothetical protein